MDSFLNQGQRQKLQRVCVGVCLSVLLFFPLMSRAEESTAPSNEDINDLRCFSEEQCRATLKGVFSIESPDMSKHWKKGAPCKNWGLCYPAGTVPLKIKIGGVAEVDNIGDYVRKLYVYLVSIGGVVATVMILFAGFSWLTSGGNSEGITRAKEMIASALLGLVLLLGANFILGFINPALINLQLPRVSLLRPEKVLANYCKDDPKVKDKKNILAAATTQPNLQTMDIPLTEVDDSKYLYDAKTAQCGYTYYVKGAGVSGCLGTSCGSKYKACVPDEGKWQCIDGAVSGQLDDASGSFGQSPLNSIWLVVVCREPESTTGQVFDSFPGGTPVGKRNADGARFLIGGTELNHDDHHSNFVIKSNFVTDNPEKYCTDWGSGSEFAGYYIGLYFDDPDWGVIDMADTDDMIAIGFEDPDNCTGAVNLGPAVYAQRTDWEELEYQEVKEYIESSDITSHIEKYFIKNLPQYCVIDTASNSFEFKSDEI